MATRAWWTVFKKEVHESLRDRRTLLTALLLGPIGAPLLFSLMMNIGLERGREGAREPVKLAVLGYEAAPQLLAQLEGAGVAVQEVPGAATSVTPEAARDAARAALRAGPARVALIISAEFPSRLRAGESAPVALVADSSDRKAQNDEERVARVLSAYGSMLAAQRLQVRGLNPALASPLAVDEVDLATPASRALVVLGMLSYFLLLATLIGGLHVAIDITAGERERGSLESLLTLPVSRAALLSGKVLTACAFMTLALAITLVTFYMALPRVDLASLGMRANFDLSVAARIFLVVLPFVPVGALLMTLVASFTKSYREAQTWLSFVILVPTLPIVFASLYQIERKAQFLLVPSLSQHLLITGLLRDEGLSVGDWALSAASCALLSLVLYAAALRCWRREALLG